MDSLPLKKGCLLTATPSVLRDVYFQRSIILLTEYSEKGSVGFMMNKPLNYVLSDLIPEIHCNFNIYQGGPVEPDNLYFVHKIPHLLKDSIKVTDKIYWGGNFDELRMLLDRQIIQPSEIRFFLGYSGWESNQLEEEVKTKSWFVSENNFTNIFQVDDETLWRNKLLEIGGTYMIWANAPEDIRMN